MTTNDQVSIFKSFKSSSLISVSSFSIPWFHFNSENFHSCSFFKTKLTRKKTQNQNCENCIYNPSFSNLLNSNSIFMGGDHNTEVHSYCQHFANIVSWKLPCHSKTRLDKPILNLGALHF